MSSLKGEEQGREAQRVEAGEIFWGTAGQWYRAAIVLGMKNPFLTSRAENSHG